MRYLITAIALTLASASPALAGGKGGGAHASTSQGPQQSGIHKTIKSMTKTNSGTPSAPVRYNYDLKANKGS